MAASEITMTTGSTPSTPASGKATVWVDANSIPNVIGSDGVAKALLGGGVAASAAPADPSGTANTTGLMCGLAGSFTPLTTGRMLLMASGNLTNTTAAAGDGAKVQLRYGTGTAPANVAALTGTAIGNLVTSVLERATASDLQGFTCMAVVTGLTIGTTYWLDLSQAAVVGGTTAVKNISLVAVEV